jgi:hypothetical protein
MNVMTTAALLLEGEAPAQKKIILANQEPGWPI